MEEQQTLLEEITSLKNAVAAKDTELKSKDVELKSKDVELKSKDVELKSKGQEIERLNELVRYFQQMKFGSSSEKSKDPNQTNLFNEAEELDSKEDSSKDSKKTPVKGHERKRGKRRPLPEEIEREDVIIEIPEDERVSEDGTPLVEIGEEVSEKLDIRPATIKVIRTIRKKYGLPNGEGQIKTALLPPSILPKSLATAGLLAYIIISKYLDSLPLYRLEAIFKRFGIDLTRTTMARWMIQVSLALQPLKNLMEDDLLSGGYVGMDETKVQVLKEKGKKAQSNSYMWVRARIGPDKPIILFDYDPTRKQEVANRLLDGFKGVLQVDGYSGYNMICKLKDVTRAGCWTHCRRYFKDATKNSKKKKKAQKVIDLINMLYEIEDKCEALTPEGRLKYRQEHAIPVMEKIEEFLNTNIGSVPPKSLTGKALLYMKNEWSNLQVYLTDGNVMIDNNFVENKIRPFAVGRRNWLFSTSVDGAEASAILYSLVITAKANGLNSYDYLRYILEELPKRDKLEEIEKLLPYNVKLPSSEIKKTQECGS